MTNLYYETLDELAHNGLTSYDVLWVGSLDGKYAISFEKFAEIANIEYDAGYGAQEIAVDLVVVGQSWWLERQEYDGSEWWEFKEIPFKSPDSKPFDRVKVYPEQIGWRNIHQIMEKI